MADVPFDLATPDEFVTIPGVAILDEHDTQDPHTGKPLRVDEAKLRLLAKNQNDRVETTGNETVLCLGHTSDDEEDEADAPPVVGFARDFYVDEFFNTGRKALFCTFKLYRDQADHVLRNYPNRSVELWTKRWQVEPIALLSSTAPERDLGLLRRERDRDEKILRYTAVRDPTEPVYHYSVPYPTLPHVSPTMPKPKKYEADPDAADPTTPEEGDALSKETSSYKELSAKLDALPQQIAQAVVEALGSMLGEEGQGGDQPPPDDDAGGPPPDAGKGPPPPADKEDRKDHEPPPVKFDAGAASGTNTFTPSAEDKKKMSRTDDTAVKYEREVATLRSEVATLRARDREQAVKLQRLRAEKVAVDLEAEGVDFGTPKEREEEVDLLAQLNDASFDAHVDRVKRKFKRKSPPGSGLGEVLKFGRGSSGPADKEPATMDEARKVADLMATGKSYADAIVALRK